MVRKRVAMAGRVKALTGEARISAIIMSALPFAVGGVVTLLKPGHLDPLFETDLGFRLLLIGGTMLVIGLHGHPRPPQERAEGLTPRHGHGRPGPRRRRHLRADPRGRLPVLLFGAKSERDILARMHSAAAHGPEPDASTTQAPGSNALLDLLTRSASGSATAP